MGGAVATLVALTVSLPVALTTLAFYIGYKLAEDYLLVSRVMGRIVQVTAIVSLIGGVLLGIIGALVAIPIAAAIRLLLQEIAIRRLDNS